MELAPVDKSRAPTVDRFEDTVLRADSVTRRKRPNLAAVFFIESHFHIDDMDLTAPIGTHAHGELGPEIDGLVVGSLDDETLGRLGDKGAEPSAATRDLPLGPEIELGGTFNNEGGPAEKLELGEAGFQFENARGDGRSFSEGVIRFPPDGIDEPTEDGDAGRVRRFGDGFVPPEEVAVHEQGDGGGGGEGRTPRTGKTSFFHRVGGVGDGKGKDARDFEWQQVTGVLLDEQGVRLGEIEITLAGLRVAAEEFVQLDAVGLADNAIEQLRTQQADAGESVFSCNAVPSFIILCSTHFCRVVRMRKSAWEMAPSDLPSSLAMAWTVAPGR